MGTVLRLPLWLIGSLILKFWILLVAPVVALKISGGRKFSIPSSSMSPTLAQGDHLLALPVTENTVLRRGSVYVFRHPKSDVEFVKRLAGLPGDTVELISGAVHINGSPLARNRIDDHIQISKRGARSPGVACSETSENQLSCCIPQFEEVLPEGQVPPVLDMETMKADDWGPDTVPEDSLFMLGASLDNLVDSRFSSVGMVPTANLKYRAWMFYFSTSNPIESLSKRFRLVEPI